MKTIGLWVTVGLMCFSLVYAQSPGMGMGMGNMIGGMVSQIVSRMMGGGGGSGMFSGMSGMGGSGGASGGEAALSPLMQQITSQPRDSANLANMLFMQGTIESPLMYMICQNNFMMCMNMMRAGSM